MCLGQIKYPSTHIMDDPQEYKYPAPEDPELQRKIYRKREFYYHRIPPRLSPMTPEEIEQYRTQVCKQKPKIQSYQAFLSEFINPETPYNGLLIFHGTGSGKTFASISIAERFKDQVVRYNTKIVILVPGPILKEQFKVDLVTVCTDYAYMPPDIGSNFETLPSTEKKKAIDKALKVASQYYRIISYKSFHKKVLGEKIKHDDQEMRQYSHNRITSLDNTVLIVDEAHNFTNNEYGHALMTIKNSSKNLRIVLLTATPMKNLADEVVPLLNFLRPINDPIEKARVFQGSDFNMDFAPYGKEYLARMCTGYVSFYRGNNPYTFAKRVDIGEVPAELLFTPLVRCVMKQFQLDVYNRVVAEHQDALDKNSEAISNFAFPYLTSDGSLGGTYGREGVKLTIQQVTSSHELQKKIKEYFKVDENDDRVLYYSKATKTLTGRIFALPYLHHFSTKFANCMENIINMEVGIAFVYTNLVKFGTTLFKEVLNSNGFIEYNKEGKYLLTPYTRSYDMKSTYAEYVKKGNKEIAFYPATYIMVSGSGESELETKAVPEEKIDVIRKVFNSLDNADGKYVKLVLGSRVVNEGVTLENVRQVHILDTHYHLGRVEQVIGRAIRQCRHIRVTEPYKPSPPVRVFRYVVAYNNGLTREEVLYKKAEVKYLTIKSTERVLIENAVDCPLNFGANQVYHELEKCYTPAEVIDNPEFKKQLCPARCEFQDCRFKCGDHSLNLNYYDRNSNIYRNIAKSHLDFGTFSKRNARLEIDFCKNCIKDLFRLRDRYSLKLLTQEIMEYYDEDKKELFDKFFLFRALTELMPVTEAERLNFNDFVVNRYNIEGYIVFHDGYYSFEPLRPEESVDNEGISESTEGVRSLNDFIITSEKKPTVQRFVFPSEEGLTKQENFIVGTIDDDANGNEVFRIRPPRKAKVEKKREKGLPTVKGSVCHFSKSVPQLQSILKKLGGKIPTKPEMAKNRHILCNLIKERLVYMETHAGTKGIPNKRFLVVPKNHPTLPYPLNRKDRIKK